jgi:hypothetical protein
MALATFKHFPDVEEVDAALFFVIAKAFIRKKYQRSDAPDGPNLVTEAKSVKSSSGGPCVFGPFRDIKPGGAQRHKPLSDAPP